MTLLVSAVMPTTIRRRRWIPHAITNFLAQDYPTRELIVASEDAEVATLLPADTRVRFVALPAGLVLGAKRNAANATAHGAVLAHWDDDDWYAPDRLTIQVALLRTAPFSGARTLLFLAAATGALWRYQAAPDEQSVCGTTLCYLRTLWERCPFEPVASGEDRRWCLAQPVLPVITPGTRAVATIHAANTSYRQLQPPCWTPADAHELPPAASSWRDAVMAR